MLRSMIERSDHDGITTLRLAHGKASALDLELVEGLARGVAEAVASETRAVVLTGSGSIFSAGVDLFRLVEGGAEYTDKFLPALSRMLLDLFTMPKPLVVAVNGHAIAGGCIIAACGDYRLMASGSGRIGVPELLVGVPFPPAVIEVLRFALPPQSLQMLLYTGRTLIVDEAKAHGLIDEIVAAETLLQRAEEVARQFASLPTAAFQLAKRQLRDKAATRAKRYESKFDDEVKELWASPATHDGIRAYLAKTVKK
jgi:enoyl-CoA hydratase